MDAWQLAMLAVGGLLGAWLAPRLGVNTSALFVDPKWLHAHLAVAMRAYHRLGAGAFAVADLRAFDPLGAAAWTPLADAEIGSAR